MKKICAVYYSATGNTKRIVTTIAKEVSEKSDNMPIVYFDFTILKKRQAPLVFEPEDIVVFGVPTYAGRVPNVLLKFLKTLEGNGALTIPVVTFGNRNFDDSLIELRDLLEDKHFRTIGAGAFVGEHAFSRILAAGRPDTKDLAIAKEFGDKIAIKWNMGQSFEQPIQVRGNYPYRPYYVPKDHFGNPVNILKDKPKTNQNCTDCKVCVYVCPMNSIQLEDVSAFQGICIKCGACVKKCPTHAKYYDSDNYLYHKEELEQMYQRRAEPEVFI